MATRFPLIANPSSNQIQELPFGDDLDLTGNNIIGINNLNATGIITSTNFNSVSDISLKDNIETYKNSLDVLDNIRGVSFTWKENNHKSVGVIAQEIESAIPELVLDGEIKSVNYNGLIGILIEAVKELKNQNKILTEKVESLTQTLSN